MLMFKNDEWLNWGIISSGLCYTLASNIYLVELIEDQRLGLSLRSLEFEFASALELIWFRDTQLC